MARVHEAVAKAMSQVEAIGKDRKNQQQNFRFRGIDDIYNALHPILQSNGLFTVPRVTSKILEERRTKAGGAAQRVVVEMEYDIFHEDGSLIKLGPVIGEGMDHGDKACSKAMAVAHKYALVQLFAIPTEDVEADEETPPPSRRADSDDRAFSERTLERHEPEDPFDALTAKVNEAAPRRALGDRIIAMVKGDRDKAGKTLMYLIGRDSVKNLSEIDIKKANLALDVIEKCGGGEPAKRWVADVWRLKWFTEMSDADYEEAVKQFKADASHKTHAKTEEEGTPF